jgi:hypothetical protein
MAQQQAQCFLFRGCLKTKGKSGRCRISVEDLSFERIYRFLPIRRKNRIFNLPIDH